MQFKPLLSTHLSIELSNGKCFLYLIKISTNQKIHILKSSNNTLL